MKKHNPGSTLTDKEKMFCAEYIIDLDATKAAIRAGYNEESATTSAYHIKQRPEVEAYITQLQGEKALRLRITADQVLLELAKIGFAEIEDFVNNDEVDKDAGQSELPENVRAKQSESDKKLTQYYYRRTIGPDKGTVSHCTAATTCKIVHIDSYSGRRTTIQFSLTAKIAALKLLGQYLGLFGNKGKAMPAKPNIIFPPKMEEWQLKKMESNRAA